MIKVFHYTKLNTAIEHILPKMQLRTGSLHTMNDPKENQLWAFGGVNLDYKRIYPETYSNDTHFEHLYRFGNEIKRFCQIICFVRDEPRMGFKNEIMWAHYSENHKGVCLELDAEIFLKENSEKLSDFAFEPVIYRKQKRRSFYWKAGENKEQNIRRFVKSNYKDLFLSKSPYWENENEQRLLIFTEAQEYLTIEKSLTGVYFGLFMPYAYKPSIDRFINEQQTKLYNLYYEDNTIKTAETKKNDNRPFILRKYLNDNFIGS